MSYGKLRASQEEAALMEVGKVYVVKRRDRNRYILRYRDPKTNLVVKKTTDIKLNQAKGLKEAEQEAATLEAALWQGKYVTPSDLDWEAFTARYCKEKLNRLAPKTKKKALLVLDRVASELHPKRPASITFERLSFFKGLLEEGNVSDTTIQSYFAHLKASLKWAADLGIIARAPKFPKIERAKRSNGTTPHRGRGITKEELERMQVAVDILFADKEKGTSVVCRESDRIAWKQYLEALWLSGLRLEESFALSWNEWEQVRVVIVGKGRLKECQLHIDAEGQKNHETQRLPLAHDFSQWLLSIPASERSGKVFSFPGECNKQIQTGEAVGKLVSKLGKMAKVVVAQGKGKPTKFASAHDLRRSFGDRWALEIQPAALRELMRHRELDTTMRYYVGITAANVSAITRRVLEEKQRSAEAGKYPKSTQAAFTE